MDFSSEQYQLQKNNHEYITKNYKKSRKRTRFVQKKTGNFQK